MPLINEIAIEGYVAKHYGEEGPQMTYTPNGLAVTKLSLSISNGKGKDKRGETVWKKAYIECVAFGELAEWAYGSVEDEDHPPMEYGDKVIVWGRLTIDDYIRDKPKVKIVMGNYSIKEEEEDSDANPSKRVPEHAAKPAAKRVAASAAPKKVVSKSSSPAPVADTDDDEEEVTPLPRRIERPQPPRPVKKKIRTVRDDEEDGQGF
jgi:single-stranded DNA-binding protein